MMEIGAQLIRMLPEPRLHLGVHFLFAEFSQSAAAMLLTALWQGLLIAAFLGLCLRFAPRVSASLRFVVLSSGFAAIAALPFLPAVLKMLSRTEASGTTATAATAAHPWLMMDAHWSVVLTLAWIAASLWRAGDLAVHSVRLRRLWKSAIPVEKTAVPVLKLPGRKPVELCTTTELERPSVIGFFAPRILIPMWLLDRLTQAELEQIVLHESEHLRRGDDWTNLLQKLSLVAFPLNPALLWMERRLCLEREMACDEGVVRRTHAPRAYAACLASLAEHGLERRVQALTLGAWQRRP
ncbi:MAG TPA: M56 family metallopeptidase, partial [Acidobacteriaceae bacterium]